MTKKTVGKPFYYRWLAGERIYRHIRKAGLKEEEEREILTLIEETVHTQALSAVLEKLPAQKHEEFLEKFREKPDDLKLIDYLQGQVEDIETHLKKVFKNLEEEIIKDVCESLKDSEE